MDQKQMSIGMIEFNKAVERLWATHDSYQKRFYDVDDNKEKDDEEMD